MNIVTTVNLCDITDDHWVSTIAKKTIQTVVEVYVSYGRRFTRV